MLDCRNRIFVTIAFLAIAFSGFAQPKDNSPFSRLGLGDFTNQNYAAAIGMGGLSAAFQDAFNVNLQNPASLGSLVATSFEIGGFAEYSNLKLNDISTTVKSGNLSYLSLAFPLRSPLNAIMERKKNKVKWGMNIAVLPFTSIGYDIQTKQTQPNADSTTNNFLGTGGLNKVILGNGFKFKNFNFGINLGLLFGQLENKREVLFGGLDFSFDDNFKDVISVRGFLWNFGLQYKIDLKHKKQKEGKADVKRSLIVGLYANAPTNFTTFSTKLRIRQNLFFGIPGLDTLVNDIDVREKGRLPAQFSLGAMYRYGNKIRVGIDYTFANWKNYKNEPKPDKLYNSQRIAAGLEFIPNIGAYKGYLNKVRYRLGAFYFDDPRTKALKDYGFSLGFGFPLVLPRQQTSFVNLAFEIGKFGESNSIKETYFRFTLGFTLNDNTWFFKRKFG